VSATRHPLVMRADGGLAALSTGGRLEAGGEVSYRLIGLVS
jgi:hypothetical protein